MKKVIARIPRMPSVRDALRAWGRRNALTPLAIASTPVRAVDPEAKARMSTKNPIAPTPTGIGSGATVGPHTPSAQRAAPARTNASIETMNAYVGSANASPDSRTPRRFAIVISAMNANARPTWWPPRLGTAETSATTPAATETATVST